jgi:uncharacterized protein YdeI (YjbR/CyaY-like superfamily)
LAESIQFATRVDFRNWLAANSTSSGGIWLLFDKTGSSLSLSAGEALEEALCFGWIDGQIKRVDDESYLKYFSKRRKHSKWSEKNKALVTALIEQGMMTDLGQAKIDEAKINGQWDAEKAPAVTDDDIDDLSILIAGNEPAYHNFLAMSASVKRTYARAYADAKTEEGRRKRLLWIIDRLDKNLKPM